MGWDDILKQISNASEIGQNIAGTASTLNNLFGTRPAQAMPKTPGSYNPAQAGAAAQAAMQGGAPGGGVQQSALEQLYAMLHAARRKKQYIQDENANGG